MQLVSAVVLKTLRWKLFGKEGSVRPDRRQRTIVAQVSVQRYGT